MMVQKFMDERSSFRIWTNYLPSAIKKYFSVRELQKIGCQSESCTHFSHDPSAPVYLLSPIWPVVAVSNNITKETREIVFYSVLDGEPVLTIEEDLGGRFWDKVFVPEP